jgi:hypothetical protein
VPLRGAHEHRRLGGTVTDSPRRPLRSRCDCGKWVRILWAKPTDEPPRPLMLICGWFPDERCEFRQLIPDDHIEVL